MPATALCDRDGLYGAPRFYSRAKELGVRPIIGAELTMEDGIILPLLVQSRTGYENLCQLLTRGHLRDEKGKCKLNWNELPEFAEGLVAFGGAEIAIRKAAEIFGRENLFVEIQRHRIRGEEKEVRSLAQLSKHLRLPLVATNGVRYATENERPILDMFTCIHHHTHLDAAGKLLEQNGERHLKNALLMRELFCDLPEAVENTVRLAERLDFTLEHLGYEFPSFPIPSEHTMDSFLRERTFAGAHKRYGRVPKKVRLQLENELTLITKLKVAGYFLIVWDIVEFCRQNNIMAQGRGSAANSTVCFCLGITSVDPLRFNTLFERFLTEGRKNCWPDIDIDLPSGERREKVIQEIYRRYGERGAAMTANVITYRGRSAAREVGKALNLSPDILNRFSNLYANGDFPHTLDLQAQMEKSGLPKSHPRAPAFVALCNAIRGLPRHLGQHSGGMIICQGNLDKIVPLENASMPGRVVAQWDKDDCEDLGIIKVDLLGLGMMSVLQDAVELTRKTKREIDLANLPQDDAKTFEMMQNADTIGVFQIESRAQMATLPRMKPKTFYDIFFSATLTPMNYYRTLLGGEPEDSVLQLSSPFPPENQAVLIHDRIQTHFKGRKESIGDVVAAIGALVQGRRGNYLVYFPSYQYLNDVLQEFQARYPSIPTLIQRPSMNEQQRDAFLAVFSVEHGETLVGFAVLGGIFGEGIDLVGERLIGAVIVGVGLPQLCVERDLIRDYFEQQNAAGFDYAYTFPGMNRVLQAVGRVIRSDTDRGVVLLIDTRFNETRYRRLFPSWWKYLFVRETAGLREAVGNFWK
jgi:error-prone DNA polymerase